jgi:hypothetical protein
VKAQRRRYQSLWDRIWEDPKGKVVIWSWPNKWLWIFIGSMVLQIVLGASNTLTPAIKLIGNISLAIWAILEVYSGVNYFRKALGVCVLVLMFFMFVIP